MTRLTVLVGGGGVGKTTLAAGLGLALAASGRRVGVLGIDPARRLRSALGLHAQLDDDSTPVVTPGAGSLSVAVLDAERCLHRWAVAATVDEAARARVFDNPYYRALASRLADATDVLAAARAVEWLERDPTLDDLVIDTAPGAAAVEFLARPEKLLDFLDGKLVRWLRRFAVVEGEAGAGRRLLGRLSRLSGADALRRLGELLALLDDALTTLVARLERAGHWLRDPSTELLVVADASNDAAEVALGLGRAVRALHLASRTVVLNRALPPSLVTRPPPRLVVGEPAAGAFVRYLRGRCAIQARVRSSLTEGFARVIELPDVAGLDAADATRCESLARLGEPLRLALTLGGPHA